MQLGFDNRLRLLEGALAQCQASTRLELCEAVANRRGRRMTNYCVVSKCECYFPSAGSDINTHGVVNPNLVICLILILPVCQENSILHGISLVMHLTVPGPV